jgi:hypothetical protein
VGKCERFPADRDRATGVGGVEARLVLADHFAL